MISVVITSYNKSKYIESCIISVKNALEDIEHEIIIIDDCSTDGSIEFLKNNIEKYNYRLLIHEENKGAFVSKSRGYILSKNQYIATVDGDDMVEEGYFKELLDSAEGSDIIYALNNDYVSKELKYNPNVNELIKHNHNLPFMLFRKNIIINNKSLIDYYIKDIKSYWDDISLSIPLYICANNIRFYRNQYKYIIRTSERNTPCYENSIENFLHLNEWLKYGNLFNVFKLIFETQKSYANNFLYPYQYYKINPNTNDNIIVSLTTRPNRMNLLFLVINNIITQTVLPKHIYIYLNNEEIKTDIEEIEFKNNFELLKDLESKIDILTIKYIDDNNKSYNKLLPVLKDFPNKYILTIDDDMEYADNLIEKLYEVSTEHKDRSKIVSSKGGGFAGIRLIHGNGGIFYPPNSFNNEVFNIEIAKLLCNYNDDMWFSFMLYLNNADVKILQDNTFWKILNKNEFETKHSLFYENDRADEDGLPLPLHALLNLFRYYKINLLDDYFLSFYNNNGIYSKFYKSKRIKLFNHDPLENK